MIAGSDEVTALIQLITNVDKGKQRLADLLAADATAAAREEKATAAEAALAQRTADIDKRLAAVRDEDLQVHQEKQRLEGIRIQLLEFSRSLREAETQVKTRMLRAAGLLAGYRPELQDLPSWEAVEAAVYGKPADPMYDDDSVNVVVERVEHAPAAATITRQRRTMRRGQVEGT